MKLALLAAAAVGLVALAGGCASRPAPASSPAIDPEARALELERRAAELRAQGREHEAIGRSYASLSLGVNDGIWARHCAALAAKLEAQAQETAALAAAHRDAAASLRD